MLKIMISKSPGESSHPLKLLGGVNLELPFFLRPQGPSSQ